MHSARGGDCTYNTLGVDIGGVLVVDPVRSVRLRSRSCWDKASAWHVHVVGKGNLALLVTNDWEGQLAAGDLVNVLDPAAMALNRVGRKTDELAVALGEFWLKLCESPELSRADWRVVLWMRKQNHPAVANEVVEVDFAVCGLSVEVWGNATQAQRCGRHCGVCVGCAVM